MSEALAGVLAHLTRLVGFDTQNPPRALTAAAPLFGYLRDALAGFEIEILDLGDGSVSCFAQRGAPKRVFNCHLDTVPATAKWTRDPFTLSVEGARAYGLGACDIKGAAACLLHVAQTTTAPMALLLTTDEEAGPAACCRHFVQGRAPGEAIVCEPTRGEAVLAHRGIITYSGAFNGVAGHSSHPRALHDNALHALTRWASRALAFAETQEAEAVGALRGVAMNMGRFEGGEKPNMIASSAEVHWGLRPLPGADVRAVGQAVCDLAEPGRVVWREGFYGAALPARQGIEAAQALAACLGLKEAAPVPFWTEAAIFSEAGWTALVCGPGDIAQAHTADEWVSLAELEAAAARYLRIVEMDG
ncbi:acetylornithine deacetylase [Myxococcota bacterium]|nr:acetylornithine deacetylase [Myxococcota bacterium]MBU1431095.1 acetylornithine deacetylase [Myxococcota bacterium]MBU1899609.1 acetylornithine deacetylase [Myxococcota bacterium]